MVIAIDAALCGGSLQDMLRRFAGLPDSARATGIEYLMGGLTTIEAKAFVPAKNFSLSKQFYQDLGFEVAWSSDDLAYVRKGSSSFLLQRFYNKEHAENFMMHLLVEDVEAWWGHVQAQGLIEKYGVWADAPADRSWGIRDFVIVDPTGVLWRIGQNIDAPSGGSA